jgi:hypothetical protein
VEANVREYLAAGMRLVWVSDPENRAVYVRLRDGTLRWLRETDELSGEDIIPGFRCPVWSIFPRKTQPEGPQPTH